MIRLEPSMTRKLLTGREGPRRRLALEHAALWGRPGFWGDHPSQPQSIVWVRQGDGHLDVFALGEPDRAVGWLATLDQPINLLAPPWWEPVVRGQFGSVVRSHVETWTLDAGLSWPPVGRVSLKRLEVEDEARFLEVVPSWALRAWPSYTAMIAHGAGFGVAHHDQWVAIAWVVERSPTNASIGVWVREDLRRIGLGRAVASALGTHITEIGATPLWVTHLANEGSRKLARSLGLRPIMAEPLLRASRS